MWVQMALSFKALIITHKTSYGKLECKNNEKFNDMVNMCTTSQYDHEHEHIVCHSGHKDAQK